MLPLNRRRKIPLTKKALLIQGFFRSHPKTCFDGENEIF